MEKESRITPRAEDFAQWYQDVVAAADLAEHSGIKGAMIIKPHGYAIWENIQRVLDEKIKETGHKNAYFPLLIPESYLKKEEQHVEGFSPELAVVTHAGGEKLEEPLVVRPTSETIINATFARWIQSWRDLPVLVNQWANVVRWELRPRLFLRTTEFLWQEGHTAHATEGEAEAEAKKMLEVYHDLAENYLAIPVIPGQKTESEKFAGALRSYTIEAMMQDGKALQAGTSHNLGQNFAKAFDVTFSDKDGQLKHVWQTSWGVSTRLIGGLIMVHSDDKGLVLPPKIAPIQVVIIPVGVKEEQDKQEVMSRIEVVTRDLSSKGIVAHVDDRDHYSPGYKFNEWEKKGIPLRLEIGPRDLAQDQGVLARRDTGEKEPTALNGIEEKISQLLVEIQSAMLEKATHFLEAHILVASTFEDLKTHIRTGNFVKASWCEMTECETKVNQETKATIRCIPFAENEVQGPCVVCGMQGKKTVIWGRAY